MSDESRYPAIRNDGRPVCFTSAASNLVPGDTNQLSGAFVHDQETGLTTRASLTSAGAQAPAIPGDANLGSDDRSRRIHI